MDYTLFPYFLISSILLTLAPGPDNLYLLAKSIANGAKSGITLAGGLASGIIFHTTLVILGVAALVKSSPMAFALLKYVGAAYLFYLAWGAFTAKVADAAPTEAVTKTMIAPESQTKATETTIATNTQTNNSNSIHTASAESGLAIYRKGLIMNILNPKVLLFFLAFLPQFVSPNSENPSLAIAFLGATFSLQAFILFSLIALYAGKLRGFLHQGPNSQRLLNRIQGVVLVCIGGLLLFF
ncbi:LysE family translocator [Veillonella sp. R32]|uniref:LysE family translocator n=1 Tax=Veillonella sp. R32 TaxID=2021312 RepID=UPI001389A70B|nr:LysE family translocator [Veillonella sp. R32]KAF1682294.1 threonine transporter RhtB [Veillonella sp. R32]